jgi:hypothetical protein
MAEIKVTELPIAANADLGTTDFFLIIDDGVTKRIPRDAVYANIQPLVKGDKGDAGATGATGAQGLRGLQGIQGIKGDTGATGATGSAGATGAQGQKGWSPILATASDGNRRVLQVADWTGGQGTKPATGSYIGSTGFVANIADGVDIRGIQGVKGDTGDTGAAGTNGADGSDGSDARQIAAITHESNNAIRTTFTDTTSVVSDSPKRLLGWASYQDQVYTSLAPFALVDGIKATLPNNAAITLNTSIPTGVTTLYNPLTSKITPAAVGDGMHLVVRFTAVPSAVNTYLSFGVDIGGGSEIFQDTIVLPRGAGTPNPVNIGVQGYALSTFLANGGLIKLTAIGGNVQVYGIEFQVHRTSVA